MDILFLTPFIFSAWSFTYPLQYRVVSGHKRVKRPNLLEIFKIPTTGYSRDIEDLVRVLFRQPVQEYVPTLRVFHAIWKRIVPAAVESCRRDWKHTKHCEYPEKGRAPLSFEYWKSPVCSCGNSKDLDDFPGISFALGAQRLGDSGCNPNSLSYEAMDPIA